jgi:hypothetical protein
MPLLLQQAADELEVRLAVLHAILALLEVAGLEVHAQRPAGILERLGEHGLDDIRDAHLLEEPRVHGLGAQPEGGHEVDLEREPLGDGAELDDPLDDAVHDPQVGVSLDPQVAGGAEQRGDVDLRLVDQQLDAESVGLRQRLVEGEATHVPLQPRQGRAAELVARDRQQAPWHPREVVLIWHRGYRRRP